jgi:hypothetical protein
MAPKSATSSVEGNVQAAIWYLRAWYECQLITPVEVPLHEPERESPDMRAAREGFALLVGLRWLVYPGQSVAFSRRFAAAWCGGRDPAPDVSGDLGAAGVWRHCRRGRLCGVYRQRHSVATRLSGTKRE